VITTFYGYVFQLLDESAIAVNPVSQHLGGGQIQRWKQRRNNNIITRFPDLR
jgi:hypothetical protein